MNGGKVDENLYKNTARLSILMEDDDLNSRNSIKEQLGGAGLDGNESVISSSSLDHDFEVVLDNSNTIDIMKHTSESKRRRSSVQSDLTENKKSHIDEARKIHKKKAKKAQQIPLAKITTEENSVKKHPYSHKKLGVQNLRELILHIYSRERNPLSWIQLQAAERIPKVLFCFISGLSVDEVVGRAELKDKKYILMPEIQGTNALPFFKDKFEYVLQTTVPGNKDSIYSPFHALTHVPLTKKEKTDIENMSKGKKITIWDLLLSVNDLRDNNYPIHTSTTEGLDTESLALNESLISNESSDNWVETIKFDHTGSRTFALDCEFCKAQDSKVLTRISIVNFDNEVILDSFVKPAEEITDYLTKYSGITKEKLDGIETTLQDIQNKILGLISSEDVLIGHSLDSDLNVLKLKHPRVIDTALCYEHYRGPPSKPSLKWLAQTYLKESIQQGENTNEGHSSVEDANACMNLVKLKIQNGLHFGMNLKDVPIFEKINNTRRAYSVKKGVTFEPVRSTVIDYSYFDVELNSSRSYANKLQSTNDDEAVNLTKLSLKSSDLIILKLRELEFLRGWNTAPKTYSGNSTNLSAHEEDEKQLANLNSRLDRIYEMLPQFSMLVITTTTGDPTDMIRLQKIKRNFQFLERQGRDLKSIPKEEMWDFEKQLKLQEAVNETRRTLAMICIKQEA